MEAMLLGKVRKLLVRFSEPVISPRTTQRIPDPLSQTLFRPCQVKMAGGRFGYRIRRPTTLWQ